MQCFSGCFARKADVNRINNAKSQPSFTEHGMLSGSEVNGELQPPLAGVASDTPERSLSSSLKQRLPFLRKHSSQGSNSGDGRGTNLSSGCSVDLEQMWHPYLLQHGRAIMAVSTLHQDGLKHFVLPGVGYLAYAMMFNGPEILNKRTAVGLSDPVCDPGLFKQIAEAFVEQHPEAVFVQVSAEFALVLQDLGFTVNSMGGETRLDLATYNFTGYARRGLRSAITSATKEGITVQEVMTPPAGSLGSTHLIPEDSAALADWSEIAAEMEVVNDKWSASKTGRTRDFWFINRRPVFAPERGVRKFIARDASGVMQGYIFFDGVFEHGRLTGYYANVTRMLPDAHPGTLNLMMKQFIEQVRSEAQMATPAKKLSTRRSVLKKQAAAAAAAGEADADATSKASDQGRNAHSSDPSPAVPLFLSLGLSPFYQMDNSRFKSCSTTHKVLERFYEHGEAFYPSKTLAAAKAKYGAGLHDFKYEDAAVQYRQTYLCHRRGKAAFVTIFDLAKFFGMWKHPADAATRYVSFTVKQRLTRSSSMPASRSSSSSSSMTNAAGLRASAASSIGLPADGDPNTAVDKSCSSGKRARQQSRPLATDPAQASQPPVLDTGAAASAGYTRFGGSSLNNGPSSPSDASSLIGTAANTGTASDMPSSGQATNSEPGSDVSYTSALSSSGEHKQHV